MKTCSVHWFPRTRVRAASPSPPPDVAIAHAHVGARVWAGRDARRYTYCASARESGEPYDGSDIIAENCTLNFCGWAIKNSIGRRRSVVARRKTHGGLTPVISLRIWRSK